MTAVVDRPDLPTDRLWPGLWGAERVAEGVGWCARQRTQYRGGVVVEVTVWWPRGRMTTWADHALAAVGLSGRDVSPADPAGVAAAVVAGFDRAGRGRVRQVVTATDAVLANDAMPFEEERHAAVWPDAARFARCRAAVDALVSAGLSRRHVDDDNPHAGYYVDLRTVD